ncbi:MAG: hypothetical protein BroJett014_20700 [Planctomycetota bacterium]|nr:MAG: hypothetical protein BroJett014_20700 [Planctomycetota bacterium]
MGAWIFTYLEMSLLDKSAYRHQWVSYLRLMVIVVHFSAAIAFAARRDLGAFLIGTVCVNGLFLQIMCLLAGAWPREGVFLGSMPSVVIVIYIAFVILARYLKLLVARRVSLPSCELEGLALLIFSGLAMVAANSVSTPYLLMATRVHPATGLAIAYCATYAGGSAICFTVSLLAARLEVVRGGAP